MADWSGYYKAFEKMVKAFDKLSEANVFLEKAHRRLAITQIKRAKTYEGMCKVRITLRQELPK